MNVNVRGLFRLGTFLLVIAWTEAGLADQEQLRERVGGVRVPFIANGGQTDPAVAYYAPTFAGTVYVTNKGEIVYSLPARSRDTKPSNQYCPLQQVRRGEMAKCLANAFRLDLYGP